jgi:hypothetical protein
MPRGAPHPPHSSPNVQRVPLNATLLYEKGTANQTVTVGSCERGVFREFLPESSLRSHAVARRQHPVLIDTA